MVRTMGSDSSAGRRFALHKKLGAHLGMLLDRGEVLQGRRHERGHLAPVTEAAHHPAAHIRIAVLQQVQREIIAQAAEHVQGEERVERIRIVLIARELLQFRQRALLPAPRKLERGLLAEPLVRMLQVRDQGR